MYSLTKTCPSVVRLPVLFKLDVDFICTKLAVRGHRLQGGLQMLELHLEGGFGGETNKLSRTTRKVSEATTETQHKSQKP